MTSYDGEIYPLGEREGMAGGFPFFDGRRQPVGTDSGWQRTEVFYARLKAVSSAIGTDDYSYTVIDSLRRKSKVLACFIVAPQGSLPEDASDYLTVGLYHGAIKLCESSLAHGLLLGMPAEVQRCSTVAQRTLDTGESLTLKISGTGAGQAIPILQCFVLYAWAA